MRRKKMFRPFTSASPRPATLPPANAEGIREALLITARERGVPESRIRELEEEWPRLVAYLVTLRDQLPPLERVAEKLAVARQEDPRFARLIDVAVACSKDPVRGS